MKTIDDRQAQALMEKFLDGATTIAEEQQLYRYFAGGEVAPVLQQYRPMMQWYDSLSADAEPAQKPATRPRSVLSRFRFVSGIAASVAVLAAIGFAALMPHNRLDDEQIAYSGSYVIVNGVKTTDIDRILPQLRRAEQIADSVNRLVASIKSTPDIWENELAGITDSVTRRMILQTIHDDN